MFVIKDNCIIEEKEPFKKADGMPYWMQLYPGSPLDHFNGDYFAEVNHHVCAV